MTNPLETPPKWPRLNISIDATSGTVALAGTTTRVAGASLDDTRLHALEVAIAHATRIGRPLHIDARDPDGVWPLVVHPEGHLQDPSRADARQLPWLLFLVVSLLSVAAASVGAALVR